MGGSVTADLKAVVAELRQAAHDPRCTSGRLTEQRLLELADLVEGAMLRIEDQDPGCGIETMGPFGSRPS